MKIINKRRQPPGYERETALIAENKKKPAAKKVHKFVPAKWTHPNGHPRCLTCGQEESISPECNREPTAAEHKAFDEKLRVEFGDLKKVEHVPGTPYRYRHGWIPVASTGKLHGAPSKRRLRTRRESSAERMAQAKTRHEEETSRMRRVARDNADKHGVSRRGSTPNVTGEAVSHGTPTEPKRGDSRKKKRIIRNRKKVAESIVARQELPGTAPMHLRTAAERHASENYPKAEKNYAGLIIRLAKKGHAQDPTIRGEQSKKYGVPVGRMMQIENEMHDIMYPKTVRREHESESVRLADMPEVQRKAIRVHGGRSASVYPDNRTRLFKSTKGDNRGKWLRVTGNGSVTEITDSQAQKDLASNKEHWKKVADQRRMNPRRWNHDRTKLLSVSDWEKEQEQIRQQHENVKEQKAAIKEQKIRIAQQWAESQGYDPEDSYWWGYYWRDPSLIKTQHDVADSSKSQPVAASNPTTRQRRIKRKVVLPAADLDQKQIRGHRPGPRRDITRGEDLQAIAREAAKASSRQRRKIQKLDPFRYIIKAEHVPGTPYHFRHGWIPISGERGSRNRAGTVTRQTGALRSGGVFDHKNKALAAGVKAPRPNRGNPYFYHGIVPDNQIMERETALYLRNNGSTKISNERLVEMWDKVNGRGGKAPSKQELRLLASSRSAKNIDGDNKIKAKDKYGNMKTFSRYDLMGQLAGKLTPGSGNRSARPAMEQLSEERQGKLATKRKVIDKLSKPQMDKYREEIATDWGDGVYVSCIFCSKRMHKNDISIEKAQPAQLGGTYTDRANRWPSHTACNTRHQREAQADPQTYFEDMMRRLNLLPSQQKKKVKFVFDHFKNGPVRRRTRKAA